MDSVNNLPSQLTATLLNVRALLEQQKFQDVVDASATHLTAFPNQRDLLYYHAVAQRMLQKIPEALSTLDQLDLHHPDYSRSFQERGHCHIFRRDATAAIEAFERAIQLNPALPASWKALETLYRMTGRTTDSKTAALHVGKLASLPVEIATARSMVADRDFTDAEALIRLYLKKNPNDVEGIRILASIANENKFTSDAEALLARVIALAPDYNSARYDYVLTLVDRHKHRQAREELETLLVREPNNPGAHVTYAGILMALGHLDQAISSYRESIKKMPGDPELQQSLGHALKTTGDSSAAVIAYKKAAELRKGFGEPFWSLANLKTYRFTDDELVLMRQLEAVPFRPITDRYHLCFALGKALEDRQEYSESFAYYEQGNVLKKQTGRYRAELQEHAAQRQREIGSPEFFTARQGWGALSAAPIFVLGMPRAGSTLLEQILASHSQVEGTMELADIPRMVGSLGAYENYGESRYPNVLTELTPDQCLTLGENYLRDTLDYRTGKTYFIDKMPNNFRNIALIQLILPNAKIIDARRAPMDCCFSNFKQLYASGHEFAYSLDDIGRYYKSYHEMMSHWDTVLPGRILRVNHEEIIEDLEGSVRHILDYCGLPFESSCVDFHKTQRRVHTASSEQVRRPINRDGINQWVHYEQWLDPLKNALGDLV
jgi:tetratricopeptide (TPR) repeat protein